VCIRDSVNGMTVDPSDPAHAYAIFNGYSRRWIPGGGVGHVFETYNGGRSWQDISGNLPDIASDALVLEGSRLALATDLGMYTAPAGRGSRTFWSRLGTGLPNASVNDVTPGPDGYIYAATHGRGVYVMGVKYGKAPSVASSGGKRGSGSGTGSGSGGGSLAGTGLATGVPVTALVLLVSGLALYRRQRRRTTHS